MCCATSMRSEDADDQSPLLFRGLVARRIKIGSIERRLDALVCDLADFTVQAQLADTLVGGPGSLQPHARIIGEFDEIAVIPGFMKVKKSPILETKRIGVGRGVPVKSPDRGFESAAARQRYFPVEPTVFGNLKPSNEWPKRESLNHKRAKDNNKRNKLDEIALGEVCRQGQSRGEAHNPTHAAPGNDHTAFGGWRKRPHMGLRSEQGVSGAKRVIVGHHPQNAHDDDCGQDRRADNELARLLIRIEFLR